MKTAIYLRVSTEEQAQEGYSLEVQEEVLKKYAQNNGLKIVKMYSDDESGYSLLRPSLKRLLSDAKSKKFDTVLVYKIDRFSRNLLHLLNMVDELESYGIAFKSATEMYDTTTSVGKLMFQQLGSYAEFERNRIIERVVPGMQKSLQRGNWQGGKPPYGYRYNKQKKLLEIHPEETELVKLIYRMYLDNKSILSISAYLFENGYKARGGGRIYSTMICDILKNKIYLGKLEWARRTIDKVERKRTGRYKLVKNDPANVILVPGNHEAIVSQEDFDLVQQKLVSNRKGKLCRNRNAGYPLTGILFCGECNHSYRGANVLFNRKSKEKRRYYRCCGNAEHRVHCKNPSFQAERLDQIIFNILHLILQHPRVKQGRMEGLFKDNEDSKSIDLLQEMKTLKSKLQANHNKQRELWKSHSEGLMTYAVYKDESITLRAEEQQLNKGLAKLDMKMLVKEKSEDYQNRLRKVAAQFQRTQEKLDLMTLKESLQVVFKNIVVKDKKIIKLELYEPFETFLREMNFDVNDVIEIDKTDCSECIAGRAVDYTKVRQIVEFLEEIYF